ncbi:somatostatin receptor type 2-like isoform X2 [Amphiura filiformis]|uniref:somatostatin receptor type 2-like isoform X2 n=1 Tax=Amphiura filiformis TaxID=82378 RepID=UPI003B2191A3
MAGIDDFSDDRGWDHNDTSNCSFDPYSPNCYIPDPAAWMIYFVGTFFVVVCMLGTLGNSTVIYVILRYSKMKTVTNCYIFNLALADLIFMFALLFMGIATFMKWEWEFGKAMCHIIYAIDGFNQFVGIFCLTAMSFDRYVAVCHALKSRVFRNLPVAIGVNIGVWVAAILAAIPILRFTGLDYDEDSKRTYCGLALPSTMRIFFIMYFFIVGFLIPLIVIIVCYTNILIRLKVMSEKTGTKKSEKSRKVNRMVLIVVCVFVLCWAPFYVWRITLSFSHAARNLPDTSVVVSDITMCISYMNSCANPFLYAFLSDNFKKSFKKVWTCGSGGDSL